MEKIKKVFLFCIVLLFYFLCSCQFSTCDLKAHLSENEFESVKTHISRLLIEDPDETIPIIEPLIGVKNASFLIPDLISLLKIEQNIEIIPSTWLETALLLARMGKEARDALPALYKCREFTKECMLKFKDIPGGDGPFEYDLACFDIAIISILNGQFDINYQYQQIQIAWLNYAIRLIEWDIKNNMNDGTEHALELINWNTPVEFHCDNIDTLLHTLLLVIVKDSEPYDCETALGILGKMGTDAEPTLQRLEIKRIDFHDDPYIMPILEETIRKIKDASQ